MNGAIEIQEVRHRYGDVEALRGVSLSVAPGEIFALLGPNGSGKTTLFRLLATLVKLQSGSMLVAGADVAQEPREVRRRLGIVFQNPSLDKKLTVRENIDCQGALYGLSGEALRSRREHLLERLRLTDRVDDRCEKLSGGYKRRVELAKGLLHRPPVLLLDEPSTGLDPVARLQFWDALKETAREGTTVLLTTHLMEEAEKADRIAILHQGQVVADGAPDHLRSELGRGLVTLVADDPQSVCDWVLGAFDIRAVVLQNQVRIEGERSTQIVPELVKRLGDSVRSITIGRPSLEDVFVAKTGCRFDADASGDGGAKR